MDPVQGFNEDSQRASEISFAYGKLRQAELRRNIWRFATKRAVLRPIDVNTLLLTPTLWSPTTTYFVGSIVADQFGTHWISNSRNNLNNNPGPPTTQWEPYFGPLTVMLYDSGTSYFSGELVYTAAGDGTYNAFLSRVNANSAHPALPSQWSVNTVYMQNQVVQTFPAWAVGTTYTKGQAVSFTDGNVYASLTNGNVGHTPSSTSTVWALMPTLTLSQGVPTSGSVTSPILEWAAGTTYSSGNFVMWNSSVYLSLANSNLGNFPNAAGSTSWIAVSNGTLSMSLIDLNLGNDPRTTTVAQWSPGTTYSTSQQATGADGVIYTSTGNSNLGHDPVSDGGVHWTSTGRLSPWTTSFIQGGGNAQWMQIGGAAFPFGTGLTGINFTYPVGAGPSSQAATRNVFRLPAGYLRTASQDPKAGSTSYLGAPSGLTYKDWVYEDNVIVSGDVSPIVLRFVADVTDVTRMDPMFCEGLAARIALEVCEIITQSTSKLKTIEEQYESFMTQARTVNGIEVGAEEPPEDDYISCRV